MEITRFVDSACFAEVLSPCYFVQVNLRNARGTQNNTTASV